MSANRPLLLAVEVFDRELTPADRRPDSWSQAKHKASRDRALRSGTAALLIVISVVHLHLWLTGYRHLSAIGPLFLVAVVSAALLAIAVAVRLNALVAIAAASFAAGTLTANILSLELPNGLFRFKEVGVSYAGGFAIGSEIGVVVLLSIWAYRRFRYGPHGQSPNSESLSPGSFDLNQALRRRRRSSSGSGALSTMESSPAISTVLSGVGPRLERKRGQRDITLTELAEATEISKSEHIRVRATTSPKTTRLSCPLIGNTLRQTPDPTAS
jgi:hypothetical protein